jgi:hypothetical protein
MLRLRRSNISPILQAASTTSKIHRLFLSCHSFPATWIWAESKRLASIFFLSTGSSWCYTITMKDQKTNLSRFHGVCSVAYEGSDPHYRPCDIVTLKGKAHENGAAGVVVSLLLTYVCKRNDQRNRGLRSWKFQAEGNLNRHCPKLSGSVRVKVLFG